MPKLLGLFHKKANFEHSFPLPTLTLRSWQERSKLVFTKRK